MSPDSDDKKDQQPGATIGVGLAIGAGAGAAIGVVLGNIALGLPIGMCIGVAVDRQRAKPDDAGQPPEGERRPPGHRPGV